MSKSSKSSARSSARRRLLLELKPVLPTFLLGIVSLLVSTYSNAILPKTLGLLLDSTSDGGSSTNKSVYRTAGLVFIVGGIGSSVRTACMSIIENHITNTLKSKTYKSLLHQSMEDSTIVPTAAQSKLLDVDCPLAASCLTSTTISFVRSFSGTVNGLTNLLQISPTLTLYSGLIVPSVGVGAIVLSKVKNRYKANLKTTQDTISNVSSEMLRNRSIVKLKGMETSEVTRYDDMLKLTESISKKVAIAEGVYLGSIFTSTAAILGYTMLLGGRMVKDKQITPGQLTSYATYTFLLGMGAAGLAKSVSEFGKGLDAAAGIYAIADEVKNLPTIVEESEKKFVEIANGEVVVNDVSFKYKAGNEQVFANLSLNIPGGSVVAITGKNGNGKSTLVSLLSNLLQPSSGAITLGGVDLSTLQNDVTVKGINVVPQNSTVFDMTVLENVMYGSDFVSKKGKEVECERVLDMVGGKGFVNELEGKFDYVVGENGGKLSGGQKQRLSLARGLVGDSKIVLFDEPDTFLDDISAITSAIEACRQMKKTVIVVTHHLPIVRLCDRVVELGKDGAVVSDGTLKGWEKIVEGRVIA
jgi:ABC-type multidrug transport system fused ATPase/permease subunit